MLGASDPTNDGRHRRYPIPNDPCPSGGPFYDPPLQMVYVENVSQPEHKYTKGTLTVIWRPALCAHSGVCARGLATVFKPKARPWVDLDGAPEARIAEQVRLCPSGALSLEEPEG